MNDSIEKGIENGMDKEKLYKGVAIHEIGHNLGGEHEDKSSVMWNLEGTYNASTGEKWFSYPRFNKSIVKYIFDRRNSRRINGSARLWVKQH